MNCNRTLRQELRQAGAKPAEIGRLTQLADQLQQLKTAHAQPKSQLPRWRRWHLMPLGTASMAGLLIGSLLVAYSQTSLPGSWLYPLKRVSEKVAVAVDPNYRATLMMRRSQEVEALVEKHAGEHVVLATLADYRSAAAAYTSPNYAAFEYCENNLKQAATTASPAERTAITSTLASLQT